MNAAETPGGGPPVVSAIVVNYRQPELLARCLESLEVALEATGETHEAIVVDNASGDHSGELVRDRFPGARLIELPENLGFAGAVDHGLEDARGEWVLLLNNDATIEPDGVEELLRVARSAPRVGSVAARMCFAEAPGVINSAGVGVDRLGVAYDRLLGRPVAAGGTEPVEVFGASGGAALYRRAMLDAVGGFDATFFFALEDVDLAWRARMAGWRCMYAPRAHVEHRHGATGPHQSAFKHYHVGLNRVRVLAKNAEPSQLRRYGAAMLAFDACYVAYALVADRTLAPLRGRLRGLREWRAYRRAGAGGRRPVELDPVRGLRAALRRRAAWRRRAFPARLPRRTLAVFHLAETSGPSRSLDAELRWLAGEGEVEVLTPGPGPVAQSFAGVAKATSFDFEALTLPRGPAAAARAARRLARERRAFRALMRERRPELVVLASAMLPAALLAARRERIPAVVYAGELFEGGASPKALAARALTRLVGSLATRVLACSDTVAAQYRGASVATIYPPIGEGYAGGDREGFRARFGLGAGETCIAAIGNITENRGQDVLIRTLPAILRERPEVRCLIVGDPHPRPRDLAFRERLARLVQELGLEHAVTFAGHQERVADVYAGADLIVNPRRSGEAFGRVPCEALVAGRPVVAMREGAVPEVLRDGETALLVPPDDPGALAAAALTLLGDPELAGRLVAAGREDVLRRFSPEGSLAVFRRVVMEAMAAGGAPEPA